ncbi:MAG: hypothetical protein ACRCSM_04320 [Sediminibacterium sp.]|jgi:hypothetical protein|nr:hypothetical protein [Sediminibacterium sp.]MBX9779616.1 hypothetical protein [Chitinophagaceae bacterium]
MSINKHNYETYFLLLVDGELNAREQEEVMLFVDANPDLVTELEALYATKLPPDDIFFYPNKQGLIKEIGNSISLENYESWFCAYVDKELTKEEIAAVELFVLQHPSLQEEFLSLQQTVLPIENIVFENKEILYRKESKKVVLIPYIRRIAIAAVFIAALFSVWFISKNTNANTDAIVAGNTSSGNKSIKSGITAQSSFAPTNEKNNIASVTENNLVRSINTSIHKVEKDDAKTSIISSNEQELAQVSVPKNNAEQIVSEGLRTPITSTETVSRAHETAIAKAETEPQETEMHQLAEKVSYKEIDTDDNNKSLYVGAIEINKDKLRGFLRKAGSIFKSKAKQEEDKTDTSPQRLK